MHPKDARRGDTEEFIRVRFVYEYNTFTTCIQTNGCLPFHQEDGIWRDRPPAKRHKGKEGYVVNDVGEAKKKEKKKEKKKKKQEQRSRQLYDTPRWR